MSHWCHKGNQSVDWTIVDPDLWKYPTLQVQHSLGEDTASRMDLGSWCGLVTASGDRGQAEVRGDGGEAGARCDHRAGVCGASWVIVQCR